MTKRKALFSVIVGLLAAWVFVNAFFDVHPQRAVTADPDLQLQPYRSGMSLREVFETFSDPGPGMAELRLLEDNNLAWAARWDLMEQAETSIDLSYFILRQDIFGVAFLGHLLKKAQEGVKIRILLDAYGSRLSWHPKGNDYLDTLTNTGNVEVRMYRPLRQRLVEGILYLSPVVALASEHDKILIVDGVRAITGGRNIGAEYFAHPDDAEFVFRDVEVEIHHRPTAMAMRKAFEAQYEDVDAAPIMRERVDIQSQAQDLDWAYRAMSAWLYGKPVHDESAESLTGLRSGWAEELRDMKQLNGTLTRPLPRYLSAETRVLDSTTRLEPRIDPISEAAARLVKSARKEVFIQNPYLVALREAIEVFSAASEQGVPIVLLTNSPASGDSKVMQAFFLEQWPYLLASIPTMQLYGNGPDQKLHAKLASFDKVLSLVGTYNLSPLSMAINSEIVVAVWSSEFAEQLTENPRARLAAGAPKTYRYRIVRNQDGTPKRDEDGEPIVEFGPEDHTDVESMVRLRIYRKILKATDMLPGVSLFF